MTSTAIISEYNPFHNGHKYHIEETKRITNSDFIVCVMSGNFVQRGEPAIINKWARTKSALLGGADIVIELPCLYASASAEYFANASVDIINKTNSIDFLSFGSDTGDLNILKETANNRIENKEDIAKTLIDAYKAGISYPRAMQSIYNEPHFNSNDILAILYLSALKNSNSCIQPVTIKRKCSNYNDKTISSEYPSAQAIRNHITASNDYSTLYETMPNESVNILIEEIESKRGPNTLYSYEKQILTILRLLTPENLAKLPHVTPGLEYRLYKNAIEYASLNNVINNTVGVNFTRTRIQRLCISALLGIEHDMLTSKIDVPYIRVLGFKKTAIPLLNKLKENSSVPVILRPKKDFTDLSKAGKLLFDLETKASDLYVLGYENCMFAKGKQDYINELIIL